MSDRSLILRGRVVAVLGTNVDTDMIYPGRYLNITDREKTAEHLFELAYPDLRAQIADIKSSNPWIVAGKNFGCGSSREQAVTALKAMGIALVIAGSYSQTYLRNAFNNGYLCIEAPELANILRTKFAHVIARREKTIISGEEIEIDFAASAIRYAGEEFAFPPLGSVPQSLVVAGGIENLVARKLEMATAVVG